jgi:tetratricopeptide (TPR) repeat protein
MGNQKSVAMALADVVNVRPVAIALQSQFGYEPTGLKFDVFTEAGTPQVMVSGRAPGHLGDFEELVIQRKDETAPELVRRSVLVAMARLDPYTTALYLLDTYAAEGDQSESTGLDAAESLALRARSMLASTTLSTQRSLFDNLLGNIALFRDRPEAARQDFANAIVSNPGNVAAILNLTFLDLKAQKFASVLQRMSDLLRDQKPPNRVLLAIAYQMKALAHAGLGENEEADQSFGDAVNAMPERPSTYEYWSRVKRERGDSASAQVLHEKSREQTGKYKNYSEIATMYFSLIEAGADDHKLTRTRFATPPVVSFR